jgi:hypothetical protein
MVISLMKKKETVFTVEEQYKITDLVKRKEVLEKIVINNLKKTNENRIKF